ncbi:MAG: peptidyl-prolyl cis-trans isomerase [Frankiales bacterium]|nr:peptidyl-prolyl cis-trans isomerase [Frankiales bacterium]
MTSPAQPPGWYPDPTGQPQSRYWDGIQWTSSTQFAGGAVPKGRSSGAVVALVVGSVLLVLLLLVGGLLGLRTLASNGDADAVTETATGPGDEYGTPEAVGVTTVGPCRYGVDGAPARPVSPPTEADLATSGTYEVVLQANVGRVVFEVDAARTPCALTSLRALARAGYFDSSPCHRLTAASIKVLQCGDPTGTGSGGPGYVYGDEALEGASYPRGTVAMANRGPATNGSQFFLVYEDSQLAPDYTPLGRITTGLDVLQRVAAAGSDDSNGPGDGRPRTTVLLEQVTVQPQ